MTDLRQKIAICKAQETEYNKELGRIDKQIRELLRRKKKLGILVSRNMNYRNKLIQRLTP